MPAATADPDTAERSATVRSAFARLRALRHGHDAGWYQYLGGRWWLGAQSSCLLQLPAVRRRARRVHHLYRDEVEWGEVGLADSHGRGAEMLKVIRTARTGMSAALLTIDEVATRLGVTESTVELRITQRALYPLYANRQAGRYFFETQVNAEALGGVWADRWVQLEERLPPLIDLAEVDWDWDGPGPGLDPLPIALGQTEPARRLQALTAGVDRGWWTYRHGDLTRPGGEYTLLVRGPGGELEPRQLPGEGVLPWAYMFAAGRGWASAFAYRPGLG